MADDVLRYENAEALAKDVAARFLALLAALQANGRRPQVALTGGATAKEIYGEIGRQASTVTIDWSDVDFWWGDERFVAADSADRNSREARDAFLSAVEATSMHEMPTSNSACSVDEGARAYEAEIRMSQVSGLAALFDLVLLSMGPDGHVASLFPGSPQADATDRIAVGVTGSPKPPPERITLTFEALNRSDRVWLFAAESGPGGAKEEAFNRAMNDDPEIPATRVHGALETTWFTS